MLIFRKVLFENGRSQIEYTSFNSFLEIVSFFKSMHCYFFLSVSECYTFQKDSVKQPIQKDFRKFLDYGLLLLPHVFQRSCVQSVPP